MNQGTTPSSHESATPSGASAYFSTSQWVLYSLCIFAGILLRWIGLDERPYHHDESLHGMYGRYFYDFPDQNYYKYNPMLHGPMLYNLLRVVYSTVGYSDWGARSLVALVGSIFLFLPFLYRRFLTRELVIALTAIIALSPTMIYWSRFLREDVIVLTGWALMLHGALLAAPSRRVLFVLLGLAVQFTTKENSFVTAAILFGYLLFEGSFLIFLRGTKRGKPWSPLYNIGAHLWEFALLIALVIVVAALRPYLGEFMNSLSEDGPKDGSLALVVGGFFSVIAVLIAIYVVLLARSETAFRSFFRAAWESRAGLALGLIVATFVYCYLYSAGFRYSQGILDGLFRESIGYWAHHHHIERIAGPFLYHFYVLSWYELPFMVALLLHLGLFYREAPLWMKGVAGLALIGLVLTLSYPDSATAKGIWKLFKLKDSRDMVGLVVFLVHPLLVTIYHLARDQRALAFFGYFFTATLFSYSYLGEKVPWLSLYPFVGGFIYLTLYFQEYFTRNPVRCWESLSLNRAILWFGSGLILLGLAFSLQEAIALNRSLFETLFALPDTVRDSWFFLAMGIGILLLGVAGSMGEWLPRYNLKYAVFIVFTVWSVRAALLTNFVYAGQAREYLSQVHTTPEYHRLMKFIRSSIEVQERGYKPTVFINGDATWPSTWYLRDIPEYKFSVDPRDRPTYDYIVQDWSDPPKDVPPGFRAVRVNLRGWWVPDMKAMTLRGFLNYALNHTPWNSPGYQYVNLLVKQPGGVPPSQ